MITSNVFPEEVAERLGPFYVYALIDPGTNEIFYIGKGTGTRPTAHEIEASGDPESERSKLARIQAIADTGARPSIDIIRHGLSENQAFLVEGALISTLSNLVNRVAGHSTTGGNREPLNELIAKYGAVPVAPEAPPAILFRFKDWIDEQEEIEPGYFRSGRGYKPNMTDTELLDGTRCWWKLSRAQPPARGVQYAVPVFEGVTRGLVRIDGNWLHDNRGRSAFAGTVLHSGPAYDAWVGPTGKRIEAVPGRNPISYHQ